VPDVEFALRLAITLAASAARIHDTQIPHATPGLKTSILRSAKRLLSDAPVGLIMKGSGHIAEGSQLPLPAAIDATDDLWVASRGHLRQLKMSSLSKLGL